MAVSASRYPPTFTFDAAAQLQDAGAVTSAAAGTRILDLGPGTGFRCGMIVIDISAMDITSTDEIYDIIVQGSASSTFATAGGIVELATLSVGAKGPKRSDSDRDDAVGRRHLMYCNVDETGTSYRYLRLYIAVGASTTPSINFTAFNVPIPQVA